MTPVAATQADGAGRADLLAQLDIEAARRRRIPSPFSESLDLKDTHAGIECDGEHVALLYGVGRLSDARAVDADMAAFDETCSRRARAHDACVPQPFIKTLALQSAHHQRAARRRLT